MREANRTVLLRAREVALLAPEQAVVLFGLPRPFVEWLASADLAELDPLLEAPVVMFSCRVPASALANLKNSSRHGRLHAALATVTAGSRRGN
ncbi:MAG: hypothetical protein EA400_14445 [Chromatiaceae bacterium]|nr:MAG: hypothetical protein EA400_14445 [Chromatiaceae bacterium]